MPSARLSVTACLLLTACAHPAWQIRGAGLAGIAGGDLVRACRDGQAEDCQALAESLDTRGFDALAPRGVRRPLRMGRADAGLLALGLLTTLGICWARVMTLLYTSETLYLQALRPLYGFVRDWL